MSTDFLCRGILDDLNIRFSYAVVTDVANDAILAHDCDPLSGHILSRSLCAAVLSAPLLNDGERYTLRWNYSGACKNVVIDVGASADVRGFVNPADLLSRADREDQIYGESGTVAAIKSTHEQVLNSGTVEAGLLDPVEDLAFFFSLSDQVETGLSALVALAQDVKRPVRLCQGVMIQALPDCDLAAFDDIRGRLRQPDVRGLLEEPPLVDNHFELIARALAGDVDGPLGWSSFQSHRPEFRCACGREQILQVVRTLPASDIQDQIAKEEGLRITCTFCARVHTVALDELQSLMG
ncbi:MAG: Hsp33 family molecular chaperone HslO [Lentisphaerae bacterium]|nr:Hsp33 family molecular chaperone HslO [Lentisphaerota bacterium]MBT4815252.1 Hsp33 family molecular chaperone HslO [Lentisphaerota bacterium]MBT5608799.1 Hsp33 family molecular chaperone HslO [Lentisphaerota bacterium]MBT7058310.1 Hsp33 family molecular chaperone HslO [Lentisphaerota bacterium]MBT7840285.1 Hsp33 family molecular chaperone HslO [Lentisphaerota bacterium]